MPEVIVLSINRKKWWDAKHPNLPAEEALRQAEIRNVVFRDDADDSFVWPQQQSSSNAGK